MISFQPGTLGGQTPHLPTPSSQRATHQTSSHPPSTGCSTNRSTTPSTAPQETAGSRWLHDYKLLTGSIVPRPIAWVSTLNEDNSNNLAPYSFFTIVSANPMVIGFSPLLNSSNLSMKDTPTNIFRQKEFVVNIVSEPQAEQVNLTAIDVDHGVDEFEIAKLHPVDSEEIAPKGVGESLIRFECRYRDHLSYGEGAGSGQFITGEVVKIHVDERLYDNGRINQDLLQPIGRGAGRDWIRVTDRFQLDRPKVSDEQKSSSRPKAGS